MASSQPIWAGGGGGFGATGLGSGEPPVETLVVGQTRVILGRLLGEGGFAFVYACADAIDPSRRYVLKKILIQDEQARLSAEKEIRLMRLLQPCPQIVRFVDAEIRPGSAANCRLEALILMEHCTGGSLLDMVRARATLGGGGASARPVRFAREEILQVAEDVARAVAALHHQRPHAIAHRDLKLENVLLTTSNPDGSGGSSYRLIDFGSCVEGGPVPLTNARERAEEEERVAKFTTQMYRAPEMVDLYMRRHLDEQVDIWALGCLLFAVAHLVHPFQDAGNLGIINGKIRKVDVPPELEDVQALIDRMLQPDPVARLTIDEVLEHIRCLQAHQPLPPRTRFTQDEELQRQREDARRASATPPNPSLTDGRPRNGSASSFSSAAVAAEAKRLDPSSAAARRLAARGGVAVTTAGPVVPSSSSSLSVAAPPPPKPPTPAGGGRGVGAADALFFSTDAAAADDDDAALGQSGGLASRFGSLSVGGTVVRRPSFDGGSSTSTSSSMMPPAVPVKPRSPPPHTGGWAAFDAPSPKPPAAVAAAFDPFPTSPGGQRRPQASASPVAAAHAPSPIPTPTISSSTSGLLGDLMAPAPMPPSSIGMSVSHSQGSSPSLSTSATSMPGDPRFMAAMLAGTPHRSGAPPPSTATASVVPPPKPPKPANRPTGASSGASPSLTAFFPAPASSGELDPFRSLLDSRQLTTAAPMGPVAAVVPPPKPPPMGGTMIRASPPPPLYMQQQQHMQQQQQPPAPMQGGVGVGMSGSGYYSAAGPPSSSVGFASSPLNSSAGTAMEYHHTHRATPPSPMMMGSGMGMGSMGSMGSVQGLQQQYSLGASSPSPYGAGFGGGGSGSVDGSPRPTSYPPTSGGGGYDASSPAATFQPYAASPAITTTAGGFGSCTGGPAFPLATSSGHQAHPPVSPFQQSLQQQPSFHQALESLSRSHSSFYEEADPFYHQTMMPPAPPAPAPAPAPQQPPQQGGGELDPYGFPTPPRPAKPGSAASPQQWPGSPF